MRIGFRAGVGGHGEGGSIGGVNEHGECGRINGVGSKFFNGLAYFDL